MSFGDLGITASLSNKSENGMFSSSQPTPWWHVISQEMGAMQKHCFQVKEKITEMRRRKVYPPEKLELDQELNKVKLEETGITKKLDAQKRLLDSNKNASTTERAMLQKLNKDFERIKSSAASLGSEATLIKVVREESSAPAESFNRINNSSVNNKTNAVVDDGSNGKKGQGPVVLQQEQLQMTKLQVYDVDEAIILERERDIKRLNHDLELVNDMYKEMAQLVEQQGVMVDNIHTATEQSREKAKAGLEQVNQAASMQSTCSIS